MLINANALHIPLADETVQCVVTSPPYWGLRDYSVSGQLGLEPTPEEYVANMVQVFREVRRVLRKDGCVFLNLGDSYYSNPGNGRGGGSTLAGGKPHLSGAQRVGSYGTSGKEPVDYQDRGCLCESLCDECRRAYRIGKSHNGSRPAPMPVVLPSETNPGHTVSQSDHLPTLDLVLPGDRNADAIPAPGRFQDHAGEPPLASRASTIDGFSQQLPGDYHQSGMPSVCLLCGRSFSRSVQEFARKLGGSEAQPLRNLDSGSRGVQQERHSQGKDTVCEYCTGDVSYPHYTTVYQLKPKDLVGIPWRVAFALQADGWWLRSDIIWHKPNPMPESVTDRPTKAHEYLFLLTKAANYYYDAEAVREQGNPEGSHPRGNGNGKLKNSPYGTQSMATLETPANGRNRRTVWTIPTSPYSGAHFATFPPDLVRPCILAGSSPRACEHCGAPWERVVEGTKYTPPIVPDGVRFVDPSRGDKTRKLSGKEYNEQVSRTTTGWRATCTCDNAGTGRCIVLDPFAGTFTVGMVAAEYGRRAVGVELSPEYIRLALERTEQARAQTVMAL